jgi:di/tricarboxylate transporter
MSLAAISLSALIIALVISCFSEVNIGILAIVFAWIVGYFGGIKVEQVIAGFPTALFLTLVALTLLFSQAQVNGTLDRFARRAVHLCRGNAGVIPMMFFVMTAFLSSIGPGNVASTALMAPLGMAVAGRFNISPFLMTIMIANGASAGSLSPIAPTGVVVNGLVAKMGITNAQWPIYLNNLMIHTVVAFAGYFLFGGLKLFARRGAVAAAPVAAAGVGAMPNGAFSGSDSGNDPTHNRAAGREPDRHPSLTPDADEAPFAARHWLTLAMIATLVVGAIVFQINVGMAAFACALVLTFARAADDGEAVKRMPWKVILMVTGVTVLVALLEKTGGLDLFSNFLARLATPATSTLVTAFFTGLISIYSSTTGVVLPALIPTVPGLIEKMGGGDPMAIISSMNSGGHLVDVSPLSTLGALCLAAAPPGTDTRRLFNQLMAWGLSMSVVGAIVCWIAFGLL